MADHLNKARKFRIAAVVALALGIISVAIIGWVAMHTDPSADDAPLASDYKVPAMDAERMYGKSAMVMERITHALKQPGTQIIIILMSSVAVAGGCWRLAKKIEE